MTWIQSIQSLLPRPEHRSNREIEDDLDAEIAFHLEQSMCEVMDAEGLSREAADCVARARFGDVEAIKKRCRRIALEERIMLQRVNFVMMLVVALLMIGLGIQMFMTQRSSAQSLKDIAAQIERMKADSAMALRDASAASEKRGGFVYIDGKVGRPGTYALPNAGPLTVARAIAAAGGAVGEADLRVTVTSMNPDGTTQERFKSPHFRKDLPADFILAPGDHVFVEVSPAIGDAPAVAERARADALYDFVKTLMTEVGPEHAADHAHIRQVLDKIEAELPRKYPNNPDLQGLIAEMIAGRRKILEYDERPVNSGAANGAMNLLQQQQAAAAQQQLETEQQKVAALQRFVQDILGKADHNTPPPVTVKDLLELARKQMGADVGVAPESRELLQRVLDDAVKNTPAAQTQPAAQP